MKNFQTPEHRVSMVLYKNRFDKTGESFYGRVHRSNKTLSLENLISLIDERDTAYRHIWYLPMLRLCACGLLLLRK